MIVQTYIYRYTKSTSVGIPLQDSDSDILGIPKYTTETSVIFISCFIEC